MGLIDDDDPGASGDKVEVSCLTEMGGRGRDGLTAGAGVGNGVGDEIDWSLGRAPVGGFSTTLIVGRVTVGSGEAMIQRT